jgi:hypothetical protein
MAPEVVTVNETQTPYGQSCDLWAVGVIAYVMLSGVYPFVGATTNAIFTAVKGGQYAPMVGGAWDWVPLAAKDLVARLLVPADQRLTAKQAAHHPWLAASATPVPKLLRQVSEELLLHNILEEETATADAVDSDTETDGWDLVEHTDLQDPPDALLGMGSYWGSLATPDAIDFGGRSRSTSLMGVSYPGSFGHSSNNSGRARSNSCYAVLQPSQPYSCSMPQPVPLSFYCMPPVQSLPSPSGLVMTPQ